MTHPHVDLKAIQGKNQSNLKSLPEGMNLGWKLALLPVTAGKNEFVLFVGHNHDKAITSLIPPGAFFGTIQVGKGGLLGPGEVTVWGLPNNAAARTAFKQYIAAFSKKKVIFK